MEDKITFTGALRWMRDSFAEWFTTSWLYIILWSVVAIAFTVLLYIDGTFSRSLAPESIEPLSFQAMGWAYRLFAASFLMAGARAAMKGIKGAATFKVLGAFASVIVCLHAFGFGFEALSDRRDEAQSVEDAKTEATTTNDTLIKNLKDRKTEIDTDTAAKVASLDAEIKQYITDGKDNDYLADDTRVRRTAVQDAAEAEKKELSDQILCLQGFEAKCKEDESKVVAEIDEDAETKPWHPLFIGLAQLFTRSWNPTDNQIYIAAITFIIFWVLLAESLVIFLPERIYVMHLRDAELARRSEAARKGHETRKENEAAKPEENIPVVDDGYWSERIKKALKTKMKNPTAEGMWNTYFPGIGSVFELHGRLKHLLKKGFIIAPTPKDKDTFPLEQWHIDFIMREGEYAPPPPKEYPVARQDEPEIEPDNEDDADAPPVAAE